MFRKKLMRIMAMILALSIMTGLAPVMGAEPPPGPNRDPFEEMRDEYLDPYGAARNAPGRDPQRSPEGEGGHPPGPDAGKTDRYIIKYHEGRRESFEGRAASVVRESVDILAAGIDVRTGAFGLNG